MNSDRAFIAGGRTSETHTKKWVIKNRVRRMDFYPGNFYLLPNPEVQYLSVSPAFVSFFSLDGIEKDKGGRTFIHSTKMIEKKLSGSNIGTHLLQKIRRSGLKIKTGYLAQNHPMKSKNYFSSIEEKFNTNAKNAQKMIASGKYIGEFDRSEVLNRDGGELLMTEINIPGFQSYKGVQYLNLPRIALTKPSIENGYREYTLGDGKALTEAENLALKEAYLFSREEINWKSGDVVLFNNRTHAHSKESHDYKEWPVVVAMDGANIADNVSNDKQLQIKKRFSLTSKQIAKLEIPSGVPFGIKGLKVKKPQDRKYIMPENSRIWKEQSAMRVFDADHNLTIGSEKRDLTSIQILNEFKKYGVVHVTNTGLEKKVFNKQLLKKLQFAPEQRFGWGGAVSGRTSRKPMEGQEKDSFFGVDTYPAKLMLLPHNEIYYQHSIPDRMIFLYEQSTPVGSGRRTFFHHGRDVEAYLKSSGPVGANLVKNLKERGFYIESGFADQRDPDAKKLYTRTWQERFGTKNPDEALKLANTTPVQFDRAWLKKEGVLDGKPYYTLMTAITVPSTNSDKKGEGEKILMYPRIAYDGPAFENGYRVYKLGSKNGDSGLELTPEEVRLLIEAFFVTRTGWHQKPGDFILLNNISHSHSRESYDDRFPRKAGVIMAGPRYTDEYDEKMKAN